VFRQIIKGSTNAMLRPIDYT